MSKLYIRDRACGYITYLHSKQEFQDFIASYLPNRRLVIGDLSTFNKPMRQMLLKFIEDNPVVDCYSTQDIGDSIIQSRFTEIIKQPYDLGIRTTSLDDFLNSDRSHLSAMNYLSSVKGNLKLLAPSLNRRLLNLIV